MRNRSHDDRVAQVTRQRLEALAAELGTPPAPVADEGTSPGSTDGEPADPRPGRHARRPVAGPQRLGLWVSDRAPAVPRGRLDLGAAHVGLVALVLAVGLVLTAWFLLRSAPSGTVAPPRVSAGEEAPTTSPAAPGPATSASPVAEAGPGATPGATPGAQLVVDVVGTVRDPGIAVLPPGSRVVDALKAAGGVRRGSSTAGLNLARLLTDGEQIVVGRRAAAAAPVAGALTSGTASPSALVNINTADQAALETLPGVGPVTATAILQWRTDHGAFTAVEELLEVSGIGDATLAEIAPHVTL